MFDVTDERASAEEYVGSSDEETKILDGWEDTSFRLSVEVQAANIAAATAAENKNMSVKKFDFFIVFLSKSEI